MLIFAIILLLILHSLQQYMFKNPIGIRDKSNAASMRNHFLVRQQQIEELRNKEMKEAEILNNKLEADRLKIIRDYLQPRSGATSLLKDFYAHRY